MEHPDDIVTLTISKPGLEHYYMKIGKENLAGLFNFNWKGKLKNFPLGSMNGSSIGAFSQ